MTKAKDTISSSEIKYLIGFKKVRVEKRCNNCNHMRWSGDVGKRYKCTRLKLDLVLYEELNSSELHCCDLWEAEV